MALVIREATIEDAPLIANISHQTFYETFAAYNSKGDMDKFLNQQFTKGKLILEVGAKANIFLLAYDGNDVAGYVKLRDERVPLSMGNANAMEVARIYAIANQIGKGVGSFLMQSCIEIAMQKNKDWLWLGVWEKNQRAIDFYTKWGFEKFDETDFLLGDDLQRDWLMKKKV
jgi:ribosomal protein S18 acetylase RimI-like enzyme